MPRPKEIKIGTLKDFADQVEKLLAASLARNPATKAKGNWYRGHGLTKTYRLIPALFRHPKIKKLPELLVLEKQMLDDFRRQSLLHSELRANREADVRLETLFYMQHYGVQTRLLDLSVNPFIALYFALTDSPAITGRGPQGEHAAVWVLDPVSWNSRALTELDWKARGPALPEDKELKSYVPKVQYEATDIKDMYDLPVATLGVSNSPRMFAQKGVFIMFGRGTFWRI
jgi:hypothetical protein